MGVAHISLQILPSSNKWAYNTITILSYTTPTIPPSQWHLMPSPLYHHHRDIINHQIKPSSTTIPSQSHTATVFFKYDLFLCRLPPWANFPAVVIHLTLSPYRPRRLVRQDFTIATNGKLYGDCQFSFIGDGLLKVNFTGNKVNITQISPCNVLDTFYNAMYLISPSGLMQWGKVHWNVSILIYIKWIAPGAWVFEMSDINFSVSVLKLQIQSLHCGAKLDLWVAGKKKISFPLNPKGARRFNFDEWDFSKISF